MIKLFEEYSWMFSTLESVELDKIKELQPLFDKDRLAKGYELEKNNQYVFIQCSYGNHIAVEEAVEDFVKRLTSMAKNEEIYPVSLKIIKLTLLDEYMLLIPFAVEEGVNADVLRTIYHSEQIAFQEGGIIE